jgi:hypothetical protein
MIELLIMEGRAANLLVSVGKLTFSLREKALLLLFERLELPFTAVLVVYTM